MLSFFRRDEPSQLKSTTTTTTTTTPSVKHKQPVRHVEINSDDESETTTDKHDTRNNDDHDDDNDDDDVDEPKTMVEAAAQAALNAEYASGGVRQSRKTATLRTSPLLSPTRVSMTASSSYEAAMRDAETKSSASSTQQQQQQKTSKTTLTAALDEYEFEETSPSLPPISTSSSSLSRVYELRNGITKTRLAAAYKNQEPECKCLHTLKKKTKNYIKPFNKIFVQVIELIDSSEEDNNSSFNSMKTSTTTVTSKGGWPKPAPSTGASSPFSDQTNDTLTVGATAAASAATTSITIFNKANSHNNNNSNEIDANAESAAYKWEYTSSRCEADKQKMLLPRPPSSSSNGERTKAATSTTKAAEGEANGGDWAYEPWRIRRSDVELVVKEEKMSAEIGGGEIEADVADHGRFSLFGTLLRLGSYINCDQINIEFNENEGLIVRTHGKITITFYLSN